MGLRKKPKTASAGETTQPTSGVIDQLLAEASLMGRKTEERAQQDRALIGYLRQSPELELGRRIQDARRKAGLTQGELAERTKLVDEDGNGITRGALSTYESGRNNPGPRELRLISECLKASPNWLIYGDDDPFGDLLDQLRYVFNTGNEGRFLAHLTYRFKKLHHGHRMAILKLVDGLLFEGDKHFDRAAELEAEQVFIELAEELKRSPPR
jgi:transcriptional regulator with XRE-family HTH domain